jgi:hypothetical protein
LKIDDLSNLHEQFTTAIATYHGIMNSYALYRQSAQPGTSIFDILVYQQPQHNYPQQSLQYPPQSQQYHQPPQQYAPQPQQYAPQPQQYSPQLQQQWNQPPPQM